MNTPVSARTLADIDRERDETTPLRGGPSLDPMELPPDDVDPIVQAMGGHHLQHDFKGHNYWLPDEASAWEFFRRVRETGHEANVADPNTVTVVVRKESKMSAWHEAKKLVECPVNEAELQEDHATKIFNTLGVKLSDGVDEWLDKNDLKALQLIANLCDRFDPSQAGNEAAPYQKLMGSWKHFLEDLIAAGNQKGEAP